MEIIERIRKHPLYQEHYEKLAEAEKDRMFCRHQMEHLLDVARIAYIYNLEKQLGIRKEVIYAAALLHDIGKAMQYTEGIAHEQASAEIAEQILKEVSVQNMASENTAAKEQTAAEKYEAGTKLLSAEEQQEILRAILGHRRRRADMSVLEKLLYISDKQSRLCFECPAEQECNWDTQKKNMEIRI